MTCSADARELLAKEEVDHPASANRSIHDDHALVFCDNLADDGALPAEVMGSHSFHESFGDFRGNDGYELAFTSPTPG